jgi:glucose-6-phosphate isomerase
MQRIALDYANCLADRVGSHGIDEKELRDAEATMAELTARLDGTKGTGWERWRLLPFDPHRERHLRLVRDAARCYPDAENLLVLGIGGSALGNSAIHAALAPPTYNLMPRSARGGPRLFVLDNVDPDLVGAVLDEIRRSDRSFEKTVVNVISKSGETAETAAQFLVLRTMLRQALGPRGGERIVAITDPEKGTMRAICDAEGYATLPVPDGVGGRFSVLSPVGLFSAAMCGLDVDELLDGAAEMDTRCSTPNLRENPAAMLAWLLITFARRGKPNHVLMPYANCLDPLADWFRQLWAESLGKRHDRAGREVFAGATPIKALGATDQHSQIQLYREGPNDKVVGFVEVEAFGRDVAIPQDVPHPNLAYLGGASLGRLLGAEKRATEYALLESERPSFTIVLPRVTARHVGGFIQMWEIATAYAGLLLDIDAFDQPAVETGKKATFGLMGRPDYEDWRTRVDERLAPGARIS